MSSSSPMSAVWLADGSWLPTNTSYPWIFLSSYMQYLVLAGIGLLVAVPKGERLHVLRAVPLYFFYAALLTVPMTVGFLNWFTVRLWRRRLVSDPYQDEASLVAEITSP